MRQKVDTKALLRQAGFKATPGRVALLELLVQESVPQTVAQLQQKLARPLNEVTLYRALEALQKAGVVSRIDLGHGHAHFELVAGKAHHHHAVCVECGKVEDIMGCAALAVPPVSKKFKTIYSHNVEFFGSCISCAK